MHITENISSHKAKVGDTFVIDGDTYEAVHSFYCDGCSFRAKPACVEAPLCASYDVNFIKINKEE